MRVLHLYHDIMNLYGEYANVAAIKRILEKNEIDCQVDRLSVEDDLKLTEYDFIYVGSGTESNQKYVLKHLQKYKEELQAFIEAGKFLLMTGNSFEMLGSEITGPQGESTPGLGLFEFSVIWQNKTRNTGDAVFLLNGEEKPLVGFVNKCSIIEGIKTPLFQVEMGMGNGNKDSGEGILYKNFYGTHLTGPLLIKNPYFLMKFAEKMCGKEMNGEYLTYEKAGYEITLRELQKRQEGKK